MTDKLPQPLLALFAPRPPLRFLPPHDVAPEHRRTPRVSGLGQWLAQLASASSETDESTETAWMRRERIRDERRALHRARLQEGLQRWNPARDQKVHGDPYATLFVARLEYATSEDSLRREFARYGPIQSVRLVRDEGGKLNGYAFLVYARERDMRVAYKEADGVRIHGRRVLVDVERGRTVKGWRPRWLGGGLGGRYSKADRERRERERPRRGGFERERGERGRGFDRGRGDRGRPRGDRSGIGFDRGGFERGGFDRGGSQRGFDRGRDRGDRGRGFIRRT